MAKCKHWVCERCGVEVLDGIEICDDCERREKHIDLEHEEKSYNEGRVGR